MTDTPLMVEQDPLANLIEMLSIVVVEDGCSIFDHSAEELGLEVMENHAAILSRLRPDPATKLADITQDVAPDLARAVERLERFCASQHEPPGYKETGPGIYFADVRAVLAALPKVDGQAQIDAIVAMLRDTADKTFAKYCSARDALTAAAFTIAGGGHMSYAVSCIGCNQPIASRPYIVDPNGETGCPACFTDDGSGECWRQALASLPNQGSQVDRLAHELRERSRFPSGQPRISPEKANEIAAASVGVLTNQGEAEILREALVEARLQLEYVDSRFPTGTTPAIIARINHALAASLRTRSTAE